MPRLLLLALLILAACEPAPPLSREAFGEAYAEALAAGDGDRALSLLETYAEGGELRALGHLAEVHARGYLIVPHEPGREARNLPVRTWPWSGPLAARRFEAALRDSAAAGSHEGLFALAERHLTQRFVDGAWIAPDPTPARALYARLKAEAADPRRLAFLALGLGDETAFFRHLEDGIAAGDPQACLVHAWQSGARVAAPFTAAALTHAIDRHEACRALAPAGRQADRDFDYGDRAVRTLTAQQAAGNADATATLDSLDALGVFERHPRLATLLPDA